jgi:Diacylglycerol kinase accessory domain
MNVMIYYFAMSVWQPRFVNSVLVRVVQYPEWFNSRFGNKLWYTGVGAKEILGHTSLNLPRRLKVGSAHAAFMVSLVIRVLCCRCIAWQPCFHATH